MKTKILYDRTFPFLPGGGTYLWAGKNASDHLERRTHQQEMAKASAIGRLQTYYQSPETRTYSWKRFEVYKKA